MLPLALLVGLSGCSDGAADWKGYAFRDGPGAIETRLIGGYGSAGGCREGASAAPSDPDTEALACGRGCIERDAEVYGCSAIVVVRVPERPRADPVGDARAARG